MSIVGMVVTFLVLWWAVLFMVLPMRVKAQWESDEGTVQGTERGAPVNPEIWLKVKRTTLITLILWGVVVAVVSSGVISFDR